jgi:hypothetical protein
LPTAGIVVLLLTLLIRLTTALLLAAAVAVLLLLGIAITALLLLPGAVAVLLAGSVTLVFVSHFASSFCFALLHGGTPSTAKSATGSGVTRRSQPRLLGELFYWDELGSTARSVADVSVTPTVPGRSEHGGGGLSVLSNHRIRLSFQI